MGEGEIIPIWEVVKMGRKCSPHQVFSGINNLGSLPDFATLFFGN